MNSIAAKKCAKNRGLSGLGGKSRYWGAVRGVEQVQTVPADRADDAAALQPFVVYAELNGLRRTGQPRGAARCAAAAASGHRTLVGGGSCEVAAELAAASWGRALVRWTAARMSAGTCARGCAAWWFRAGQVIGAFGAVFISYLISIPTGIAHPSLALHPLLLCGYAVRLSR